MSAQTLISHSDNTTMTSATRASSSNNNSEMEEVLIKTIRLCANMSIESTVGLQILNIGTTTNTNTNTENDNCDNSILQLLTSLLSHLCPLVDSVKTSDTQSTPNNSTAFIDECLLNVIAALTNLTFYACSVSSSSSSSSNR